ncbi:MAG: ABC transporter ATP-binding protein [Candidatus Eisenbacteria bacterium]
MSAPAVLRFTEVTKIYGEADGDSRLVLRGVNLTVEAGLSIAVIGRSGSGKSTLLHLAAGIDQPTAGRVEVVGRDLGPLRDRERAILRREAIGLVFQFFHLLPHLSVQDNVALPAMIAGRPWSETRPRVLDLLARVGLGDRAHDSAQKLSGGEMQRVAICRALLLRPKLLLADEPTGNLDDAAGRAVMDLLLSLARDEERALVYVTHSLELASSADRVWRLHDGQLEPA